MTANAETTNPSTRRTTVRNDSTHSNLATIDRPSAGDADRRARNLRTVERYLETGIAERLERYRLYTEDGSAALWFTDTGEPIVVQGRENLRKHGALSIEVLPDWRWYDASVIETSDPDTVWVECRGEGTIRFPGYPEGHYRNRFLHCFELDDGMIVRSREISNPVEQMRSLGIDVPGIERGWIPSTRGADPDAAGPGGGEDEVRRTMLETLVAPFRAYALYAAAKLSVPDAIRDGYRLPDALAAATGTDPDSLRRLVRALSYQDIVTLDDDGGYSLAEAGEMLCTDHPSHMRDLALLYGEQAYPSFAHIVHCLRTGEQGFPLVFGSTFLEHYARDAEAGKVFDRAMSAGNAFFHAFPAAVDLPAEGTVCDVGGGDGTLLEAVLTQHPDVRGVLAENRPDAGRRRFDSSPVGDRAAVEQSDFFTSLPAGHDVYLLSRILHDWNDEDCVRILSTIREAMAPGTRLLIVERVIGLPDARSLAVDWDLHMLVNTGGVERTLDEYVDLLSRTGFSYNSAKALPQDVMVLCSVAV